MPRKKKELNKVLDFSHLNDEQFKKLEKHINKWLDKNIPVHIEVPDYVVEAFNTVKKEIKIRSEESGQICYQMQLKGFKEAVAWLDDPKLDGYVDMKKYKALLEKVRMNGVIKTIEYIERKEELISELNNLKF